MKYRAQYLKITQKVAFDIASEASYVYILSEQKFIKNAKNYPSGRVFESLKLAVKTVLPEMSILKRQRLMGNATRHFEGFYTVQ